LIIFKEGTFRILRRRRHRIIGSIDLLEVGIAIGLREILARKFVSFLSHIPIVFRRISSSAVKRFIREMKEDRQEIIPLKTYQAILYGEFLTFTVHETKAEIPLVVYAIAKENADSNKAKKVLKEIAIRFKDMYHPREMLVKDKKYFADFEKVIFEQVVNHYLQMIIYTRPKNPFQKRIHTVCPECGSDNLLPDKARGDIVCNDCGLVISQGELDRVDST